MEDRELLALEVHRDVLLELRARSPSEQLVDLADVIVFAVHSDEVVDVHQDDRYWFSSFVLHVEHGVKLVRAVVLPLDAG